MNIMIALTLAGFVASFTAATVGVGGGLLVMPLLALLYTPRMVVASSAPMFWASAMVTFYLYRKRFNTKRVWMVIPGVIAGIFIGTVIVQHASPKVLQWVIGGVALSFALISIVLRPKPGKTSRFLPNWTGTPISVVAGVVSALSNIGGTLLSVFLISDEIRPEVFVGGIAFLYVIMTTLKMVLFTVVGILTRQDLLWSLPSIFSIVVGALLGRHVNHKISALHLRWIVISVVGISSIMLFIKR